VNTQDSATYVTAQLQCGNIRFVKEADHLYEVGRNDWVFTGLFRLIEKQAILANIIHWFGNS